MALTSYGGLTDEQRTMYELQMLIRGVPSFLYLAFGQQGVHDPTILPENKGQVIQWRKLSALTAVTTALTEGVTPDSQDISITATTGTVSEFGSYVRYTKALAMWGIDKVAAEAANALGEQAGDSLDQITRAVVVASGTAQYADDATDTNEIASTDVYTAQEALESVATLKANNAIPAFAGGLFPAIVHPYTEYDMFLDPIFQSVLAYSKDRGEQNPWTRGYVGDAFGISYYCSSNAYVEASAGAGSIDVYHTTVFGKDSFGLGGMAAYMPKVLSAMKEGNFTGQKVMPLTLIHKDFKSGGSIDPLEQRASIAWLKEVAKDKSSLITGTPEMVTRCKQKVCKFQ
jgi:N4-gp56 family major capsid protein